ncbi:methyltransferase domain-containing protein [Candidatus Uhrbacteria bacterium]|nr:methyltransferase domain-containing protein [Candidatus Uhrbacteria bacterium]
MSWLYERHQVVSEVNGTLEIVTWFGKTAVLGDGVFQSGRYMQRVFGAMLRMLPRDAAPKRILVVGLGAGGCVPVIQRQFSGVHIVALEYDEVMIALAKQTYLRGADLGGLEILKGDMRQTLALLQTEFDLILVDVFCGRKVAPALTQEPVLQELSRLLSWRGYMIVNLFKERSTLSPIIEQFFSQHAVRRACYNEVCLYRHYGMGRLGEGVPQGFEDREQSRTYLEAVTPTGSHREIVEQSGMLGVRMRLWSFSFEHFVHEREPDLRPTDKIRVVCWQPYRGDRFLGWRRIPGIFTIHFKRGVAILPVDPPPARGGGRGGGSADYWKFWSSHARRHREKFLGSREYTIEEVDLETFAEAYHATKFLDPLTRRSFVNVLKHHLKHHPQDVHLRVVCRISDSLVIAGLATIDYADISQSDHVIAFVHPSAQKTSAGVGLIDDWFARCMRQGLKFLQFGLLHRPGDPRSWKAYTAFKRQFHLYEIQYPHPVWRIVWPKRRVI